jgi:ornithine carbamoyltransferase
VVAATILERASPGAGRDLLGAADFTPTETQALLRSAIALKARRFDARAARPLAGRTVALLFQKPSLRTRVSFEIAVRELGGEATYLSQADIGLGTRESAEDVARTLDRWVAAIVARTFEHRTVEDLARASSVPVINALSDLEHPCQALADLLTLQERFGRLRRLAIAFVGEANNVFRSLALAGAGQGIEIRLAHPAGYAPDAATVAAIRAQAALGGGRLLIGTDPRAAVRGADAVYTDTWVSMGDEAEADARRRAFARFRVDERLMAEAPSHAVVMHCLPAHRGEEIDATVLDGPRSIVFDQAENRLHVQKQILMAVLPASTARADLGATASTARPVAAPTWGTR